MVEGRDSAYAPNDAQLAAFYAQGVRVYGGYIKLGNDGVLNGWTQGDFARVRGHGMTPIAFFSGFDDPATVRAIAASWGVLACLDDESGMRPDGAWVQGELDASGAGQYGNAPYQHWAARFHILAAYPTSGDPGGQSWPSWVPRPSGPCGWQWAGSHGENGITVDSSWFDDSFSPAYSGGAGSLGGNEILDATDPIVIKILGYFDTLIHAYGDTEIADLNRLTTPYGDTIIALEHEIEAAIKAIPAGGASVDLSPVTTALANAQAALTDLKAQAAAIKAGLDSVKAKTDKDLA